MDNTVEKKLSSLLKLQQIDSKLDEIKKVRGALPEEVGDLEDEVAGYDTRLGKFNKDLENLEEEIEKNKNAIKDSEKLIQKYSEQQMNVRNNREYDAITKETELQTLEIQISEKKIKESYAKIEDKKEEIANTNVLIEERKKDLESKRQELDVLVSESEGEEQKLRESREKASKDVDERLLNSYNKIRDNARNGLAVVAVKRGACGGCFNIVPPQRQADIRDKKKIIVCEHCGRILADVEVEAQPEEKKAKRSRKTK
ncbi:C4-type zinc ribbon domain-containing protein [Fulvivirgaceae bacterium BMA12]|uniref:C4-type zinc ribbon domain-containing protein n=1 Tax=Agaribacillus aureus TaxID=3051825 RepID=A0ABT8L415_9BACT|nr:C4-type zinc ribbon domain-containing protein [Fulvivirgaceae bacterium BMA12]